LNIKVYVKIAGEIYIMHKKIVIDDKTEFGEISIRIDFKDNISIQDRRFIKREIVHNINILENIIIKARRINI